MTEPKRKVGRPHKVVEDVNPDREPATKGYVKCIGRTYHKKQTQYILEHRRESSIISVLTWGIISTFAGVWSIASNYYNPAVIAFYVSLAFAFNSTLQVVGYSDTINSSQRKGIEFLEEAKCEKKKDCE